MSALASIYKKIAEAKAAGGGNIIKDGKFLFAVEKLLIESKFNGTFFIAEHLVLKAEKVINEVEPNQVGTTCSIVYNLDRNKSAAGNTKAYVLALLGYKEENVSEDDFVETLQELVSANQPARGMVIGDETFRKTIQSGPNSGKPFTGHKWEHVLQSPEDITKMRAMLDNRVSNKAA